MNDSGSLEIFVRGCSFERLVAWAGAAAGPLAGPFDCGASGYGYTAPTGTVIVTLPAPGGPYYMGVRFGHAEPLWATPADCARAAVRDLGCVARCEPGPDYPDDAGDPTVLLEVRPSGEEVVHCDS